MVWHTGSETYNGNLEDQYANGSYTEVWFKEATVGIGTNPTLTDNVKYDITGNITLYPNPVISSVQICLNDSSSISSLKLYSLTGLCIINKPFVNVTEIELDLSHIESGSYYLVIENEFKSKKISKIIKQ